MTNLPAVNPVTNNVIVRDEATPNPMLTIQQWIEEFEQKKTEKGEQVARLIGMRRWTQVAQERESQLRYEGVYNLLKNLSTPDAKSGRPFPYTFVLEHGLEPDKRTILGLVAQLTSYVADNVRQLEMIEDKTSERGMAIEDIRIKNEGGLKFLQEKVDAGWEVMAYLDDQQMADLGITLTPLSNSTGDQPDTAPAA